MIPKTPVVHKRYPGSVAEVRFLKNKAVALGFPGFAMYHTLQSFTGIYGFRECSFGLLLVGLLGTEHTVNGTHRACYDLEYSPEVLSVGALPRGRVYTCFREVSGVFV